MTVSKWFSCLFFVGLAWAVVSPAHIITSAASRRNACSWPRGVPSSDACETTLETRFEGRRVKPGVNKNGQALTLIRSFMEFIA